MQQPSVYQDLLLRRLQTLDSDHIDDRINWVTAASGPLQRPTYTALFYLDGVEIGRGAGPTRGAAKESAAARALARLPCLANSKSGDVQSTDLATATSTPQPPQLQTGQSADAISGWRTRIAEGQQREGGQGMALGFRLAQPRPREPNMLRRDLAALQITPSA
ncbi:hypothetical protein V8E55_007626 [Tylopilus felleus]